MLFCWLDSGASPMERKPKRRTRERILATALELFNRFGEPSVPAAAVADEMGISPGNLYYHFRSKDEIVEALFSAFRAEIEDTLAAPERRPPHVEDVWLFLHLVFEAIWRYRFLYRDINDLLSRNRTLEVHFKRIIDHKVRTGAAILHGLVLAGEMRASRAEIETLAVNMTVIATYWLSFEFVRNPRAQQDGAVLARGAFHVMSLAAPYLAPKSRALFDRLAAEYVT
ncbi:MAG TPA: TetR/AcrR family transcriptional regulator [Rhodocyclaceae bacterium]|nr:TetR/AcrR family transcriptional regulator [Rhodocyclaceae bacterium]